MWLAPELPGSTCLQFPLGMRLNLFHGRLKSECLNFATGFVKECFAMERDGQKKDDIVDTTWSGKLGEWAAYKLLVGNVEINAPDMRLYGVEDKEFGPDIGQYGCKTYPGNSDVVSWVFQKDDLSQRRELGELGKTVLLVVREGWFFSLVRACNYQFVIDHCKPCRKSSLHKKTALYMTDCEYCPDVQF